MTRSKRVGYRAPPPAYDENIGERSTEDIRISAAAAIFVSCGVHPKGLHRFRVFRLWKQSKVVVVWGVGGGETVSERRLCVRTGCV